MKKVLPIMILVLILTAGCGKTEEQKKKDKLLGTWETKYTLAVFGEVTESYVFEKEGKCVRTVTTDQDIKNDCTYEFDSNNEKIRILWDNKLDKENYSKYEMIDDNTIKIGENTYTKKSTSSKK